MSLEKEPKESSQQADDSNQPNLDINNDKEKNTNNNGEEEEKYISSANEQKYNIKVLPDTTQNDELFFKVLILGDPAVGKTSLSLRATKGLFQTAYKATIGFDIFNYIVDINGSVIKLQIWDTCGLEEFSACTPSLYKNASLALIVYAIDKRSSFENVSRWVNLVRKSSRPETLIFLVGNKADLVDQKQITTEEGQKAKEEEEFGFFIETSAKDGLNIQNLFKEGCIQLYEQFVNVDSLDISEREDFTKRKDSMALKKDKHTATAQKKGCC